MNTDFEMLLENTNHKNHKKLPKGVVHLAISQGVVSALVDKKLAKQGLAVQVGNNQVPLEKTDLAADYCQILQMPRRPEFDLGVLTSPETSLLGKKDGFWVGLNELKDWVLSGSDTVQILFNKYDEPTQITLKNSINLPPHSQPLLFSAQLAVHRASGNLILIRRSIVGGKLEIDRFVISFDTTRSGGQSIDGYCHISQVLEPLDYETELEMTVEHVSYLDDGSNGPPYFFIADPKVQQNGLVKTNSLNTLSLAGKSTSKDPIWLEAKITAMVVSGSTLELVAGNAVFPLVEAEETRISIIEDHGHSLLLEAGKVGAYRFYLNGEYAFSSNLEPNGSWVRFPLKHQIGGHQHLMITDAKGIQKLFTSFILLPTSLTPIDTLHQESRAPFPIQMMTASRFRYDALRAHMKVGVSVKKQAQIVYALSVVEGGHANVKLKPLQFENIANPDVSIVIPAHNKIEITYLALASLLLAQNDASFEVIVVDDASNDATAELENFVSGIKVIHNKQPQRFIRACNAGVKAAHGKFVVLLNNDVEVTNGWLDALIDAFDRFDNVGLVGAKLLYPNGDLQDAGGIIWGSGNPWNYGNRQNPWEPRFCYARQADYLSGAALMTTKAIWDKVGGLSSYLEPMYFEDTDLSFKIRDAGYTTYFVPSSIIYHFEGMTSGTDTSAGFKRFQEVNRPKFKRRWAAAFSSFSSDGILPDLEKDRGIDGRVLFIDYATPRPDRDAGSYAAIQEIKLVQSLGYKVTFLPRNMAHMGIYTSELERIGVEVIRAPFFLSINEFLEKHAQDFDAFYITRYYVAQDVLDNLREFAPQTPVIFNNADLHFLRELRAAIVEGSDEMLAEARLVRKMELNIMQKVDVVLSYNEVEHVVIQSHTDGQVKVCKCPWVVKIPPSIPSLEKRSGISFLGNYDHKPNAEGVIWFVEQVMPQVEVDHPDLKFFIYGSKMRDEIRALKSEAVRPEGFVTNISEAYDQHRIFVAPLLSGAGIKGKVLAALGYGIPCILTPTAAEGIGVRHGHDCLIAKSPTDWQKAVHTLQTDDDLWCAISKNARAFVEENYSFAKARELMRTAFESIDMFSLKK